MLRVIRKRLASPSLVPRGPAHRLASASALSSSQPASLAVEEPYGQAYGAGPSRLPYINPSAAGPAPDHPPLLPTRTRREILLATRELRRVLSISQSIGQYANPTIFSHHLRKADLPFTTEMSRLELHAVIHHLMRLGRSTLALGIITQVINSGASSRPQIRHLFSQRTLRMLLRSEMASHQLSASIRSAGPKTSIKLERLVDLLRSLQSIRHHRPMELYTLLVQMSVYERRPDKAAEIFVGLVEEWVTEGRVAEGADATGFYEGGGPPRILSDRMAQKHRSWWTGVRAWTLPGEVLSPHDRLDLWHPAKLSLGGKFRSFPFPLATSPPSMVPPPSGRLLDPILSALRLDPAVAAPADFTASMRACAILANTVLSRTLPLSSLGPLLRALEATPSSPPVYPASLAHTPPSGDLWAYEAFTQIHLALQSFFFSPPISAASFALARANETILSGSPATTYADKYRLQPLGFGDGVILVKYALEKMRMTKVVVKLVEYLKRSFNLGWARPTMWNTVLSGATVLGDEKLARVADNALFGKTPLARGRASEGSGPGSQSRQKSKERERKREKREEHMTRAQAQAEGYLPRLLYSDRAVNVQADETSLVLLLQHLGKTSQFDRLTSVVYTLIPFLSENKDNTPGPQASSSLSGVDGQAETSAESHKPSEPSETSRSGRTPPNPLTPSLYNAILSSLALAGQTGLAQRVYHLALDAERQWAWEHVDRHPTAGLGSVPQNLKLPMGVFTAMLHIWGNEVRVRTIGRDGRQGGDGAGGAFAKGWKVGDKSLAGQPRYIAAGLLARSVYLQAASRFPSPPPPPPHSSRSSVVPRKSSTSGPPGTPDAAFFDMALRALAPSLGFHQPTFDLSPKDRNLLNRLVGDMDRFAVPVPEKVRDRCAAEQGESVGVLKPREYRVVDVLGGMREREGREGRAERLRGMAEGLLRAQEEGMWRDQGLGGEADVMEGLVLVGQVREVEVEVEQETEEKERKEVQELIQASG